MVSVVVLSKASPSQGTEMLRFAQHDNGEALDDKLRLSQE